MRPCFNDHVECFLGLLPRLTENQRKKAAAKVRVINHREKLYANPQLLEECRRKERERYMARRAGVQEKVSLSNNREPSQAIPYGKANKKDFSGSVF